MSLITCCPACATMFKVVPDQLKIADGWVRCGHCSEVFDATVQLQSQAAALEAVHVDQHLTGEAIENGAEDAPEVADPQVPTVAPDTGEVVSADTTPIADVPSAPAGDAPYPPFVLLRPDRAEPEPEPEPEHEHEHEHEPAPAPAPAPAAGSDDGSSAPQPLPESSVPPAVDTVETAAASRQLVSDAEPVPTHGEVGFVRQARLRSSAQHPGARRAFKVLAPALAVLLVLQFAVDNRDRLAAAQPALRPALESLCLPLACAVGPPKQIEAIAVDNSSFTRLRGDAFRLTFTLKNLASTAVAMPSIELTLTDTQDQPVLRRVLTTTEIGSRLPALGATSEWTGSLALSVAGNGATAATGRIAGYRLLAFYP